MKIPKSALPFINLQRSGYDDEEEEFQEHIGREFEEMKPYLPDECGSIIDIGCGLCGIDFYFSKKYQDVKLFLVDKNKIDKNIHYNFHQDGSFYNSFEVAKEFLDLNGIGNYQFIESEKSEDIPDIGNQDLIVSLLSCGYHYPVEKYINAINRFLSDNGILILDIRDYKYDSEIEVIKKILPVIQIISNYNKSFRICARRK